MDSSLEFKIMDHIATVLYTWFGGSGSIPLTMPAFADAPKAPSSFGSAGNLRLTGNQSGYKLFDDDKFVKEFKNYCINGKSEDIAVTPAVKIYRDNKEFLSGNYSYMEFISKGDKPSFFIFANAKSLGLKCIFTLTSRKNCRSLYAHLKNS